jgi:hypothetical protein
MFLNLILCLIKATNLTMINLTKKRIKFWNTILCSSVYCCYIIALFTLMCWYDVDNGCSINFGCDNLFYTAVLDSWDSYWAQIVLKLKKYSLKAYIEDLCLDLLNWYFFDYLLASWDSVDSAPIPEVSIVAWFKSLSFVQGLLADFNSDPWNFFWRVTFYACWGSPIFPTLYAECFELEFVPGLNSGWLSFVNIIVPGTFACFLANWSLGFYVFYNGIWLFWGVYQNIGNKPLVSSVVAEFLQPESVKLPAFVTDDSFLDLLMFLN